MKKDLDIVLIDYLRKNASMIFIVTNKDGKIIEINKYTQELVGNDLIGQHLNKIFLDFDTMSDPMELAKSSAGPSRLNVNTAKGLPQTFICTFFKSTTDGTYTVIGEHEAAELEKMRSQMLGLNNELTNLSRELNKKNAELAHLNEIKNQLLGMAAHDLRNPLTVIKELSSIILESMNDNLNEKQRAFLTSIYAKSCIMNDLVEDLLDVSVIESGSVNLNLKANDISALLTETAEFGKMLAARKNIQIMLALKDSSKIVNIDRNKMRQVIENLLTNAIKFSYPGTTVEVAEKSEGDKIIISVTDHGQGIPPQDVKKLFEPFAKLSPLPTAGEKSTGLGLAIVQRIIKAHNGIISVKSVTGKGTTFNVALDQASFGKGEEK